MQEKTIMIVHNCTVSGKVCEEQVQVVPVNEGDGDATECIVKPVDDKIRHQMYVFYISQFPQCISNNVSSGSCEMKTNIYSMLYE